MGTRPEFGWEARYEVEDVYSIRQVDNGDWFDFTGLDFHVDFAVVTLKRRTGKFQANTCYTDHIEGVKCLSVECIYDKHGIVCNGPYGKVAGKTGVAFGECHYEPDGSYKCSGPLVLETSDNPDTWNEAEDNSINCKQDSNGAWSCSHSVMKAVDKEQVFYETIPFTLGLHDSERSWSVAGYPSRRPDGTRIPRVRDCRNRASLVLQEEVEIELAGIVLLKEYSDGDLYKWITQECGTMCYNNTPQGGSPDLQLGVTAAEVVFSEFGNPPPNVGFKDGESGVVDALKSDGRVGLCYSLRVYGDSAKGIPGGPIFMLTGDPRKPSIQIVGVMSGIRSKPDAAMGVGGPLMHSLATWVRATKDVW
ncbi:MAG: hypothetical protein IV100_23365 [Myxococcales bacterium]|nr:hypothetical protein [Myxococcales bacterium]